MSENRPPVPTAVERQLMMDAGWKCSVPSCGVTAPLEIEHILEWAKVGEHTYENLIVLCRNHHGMKKAGSRPRELNAAALRILKANQLELSGRFGDVERRIIDYFVARPEERAVFLPGDFEILLMRLMDANFIRRNDHADGIIAFSGKANPKLEDTIVVRTSYEITDSGLAYVSAIREIREAH